MINNHILNKIFNLTSRSDKFSLLLLSCLTFIGLILELIGIAIIIPVINIAVDPSNQYLKILDLDLFYLSNNFGFDQPILFLSTLLIIVFLIKMGFLTYVIFRQKKFVADLVKKTAYKLYYNYLNQEYRFYSEKNKSSIIQNLQNETYFLFVFFESYITLISEILLIISLLILLFLFEPIGLMILLVFFSFATLLYIILVKNRSIRWGNERLRIDDYLSKLILESFGNIKEILIYNTQDFFTQKFKINNLNKSRYMSYRLTIDQFPKIYYEFAALVFIFAYTYFLVSNEETVSQIITKLGLIVAISYKIIPSLSRVSVNYQTIKNYSSSLIKIHDEIVNNIVIVDHRKTISSFNKKVSINKLFFSHNNSNKLFNNFNFEVNKNETIGLIGESGSGKTTLLDIISGLHNDFEGELEIDGKNLTSTNSIWKPKVGYVSQRTFLFQDTIRNNIVMSDISNEINDELLQNAIKLSSLSDWIKSLPEGINTNVGQEGSKISEGQKQRIGIARSLYLNPEILIFDEPTSALDPSTSKDIFNTIYSMKGKKTIIIVSHSPSELNNCDRVINLNDKL